MEISKSILNIENSIHYAENWERIMKKKNCRFEILMPKYIPLFEVEQFKANIIQNLLEQGSSIQLKQILNDTFEKIQVLVEKYSALEEIKAETKNYSQINTDYYVLTNSFDLETVVNRTEILNLNEVVFYNVSKIILCCKALSQFLKSNIFIETKEKENYESVVLWEGFDQEKDTPFGKKIKLRFILNHFDVFVNPKKSKNQCLTNEQFKLFIRKAFFKEDGISSQKFNYN